MIINASNDKYDVNPIPEFYPGAWFVDRIPEKKIPLGRYNGGEIYAYLKNEVIVLYHRYGNSFDDYERIHINEIDDINIQKTYKIIGLDQPEKIKNIFQSLEEPSYPSWEYDNQENNAGGRFQHITIIHNKFRESDEGYYNAWFGNPYSRVVSKDCKTQTLLFGFGDTADNALKNLLTKSKKISYLFLDCEIDIVKIAHESIGSNTIYVNPATNEFCNMFPLTSKMLEEFSNNPEY